ncbi:MAG TPA: aminotransferase class III-fold pyridoxal phosphate-dependent enzyme [Saprospiraceae bacterium]|nr:aminotransferase class III-fold pyridoxal phosphate-dependent enzyme [Saprospiraceae bacterium]
MEVSVKPLPGEIDLNFFVKTPSGEAYTLKIANPGERRENLEFQHTLIRHLVDAGLDLEVPNIIPSVTGDPITVITAPDGAQRFLRLLTWIEGRCFADVSPHTPELLERVGEMCGKLCAALADFDHPAAHRFIKWDPSQAAWTSDHLSKIAGEDKQALAEYFYQLFEQQALPLFPDLRKSVNYNDANDYNILVSHDLENPVVPGVIDFGDAVFTHTVNDLAIAAAYAAMHKPDPLAAIFSLTKGFHRAFPLTEAEAAALFPLIGARLLISVTCSAMNLAENPENEYLQISDRPAWDLLERLRDIPPALAHATVRHACGWEPCPKNEDFIKWVKKHQHKVHPVVAADLNQAIWLDLSVGSADLGNYAYIEDAEKLHRRIEERLTVDGTRWTVDGRRWTVDGGRWTVDGGRLTVGLGCYDETRPFYTTDAYEVRGNEGPEWRSVHIGLDIFMPPGTPVFAPLDGVVHSFKDNANDRDYGPTIILEHRVSESLTFYTLYGHLTRRSLEGLQMGKTVRAGQEFCQIGPMPENGNWSPHLHFQVILDMLGWAGDFPGVAFPEKRAVWKSLCPDPWLLLTGHFSPKPEQPAATDILEYRAQHLGKNLSVSYQKPLTMLRGWRQYLFDDTGRRYLDTVNNVAHVGHEHPRVVRAGQRQMAVLNTNTRYLHGNIVRFTEELLATFPSELRVAFLVNSGSEANELAMRLAKNYTGQKDMIVVEVGYHGNTQGCVDISSYKFDGPGGNGAPPFVHVTPIPDVYRGLYRGNTPGSGKKYAAHVAEAVQKIRSEGCGPAAFICESVISCGGQIPLPPGYLAAAVKSVRGGGGLYIADEVQTGCGRHGRHFWAFEEHGVTPDIVTIGKPIGNGHPLGVVVTTLAIADAFANGMEYFNTFGGNPVSCAIGLEVLRVIRDEGLQQHALETGAYLNGQLLELARQYPVIGDVRGTGLFLGFELVKNPETLEPAAAQTAYLANRMRTLGVLMSTDGPFHNVLKIKPPMVFDRRDADFLAEMLDRVLQEDFMRLKIDH